MNKLQMNINNSILEQLKVVTTGTGPLKIILLRRQRNEINVSNVSYTICIERRRILTAECGRDCCLWF